MDVVSLVDEQHDGLAGLAHHLLEQAFARSCSCPENERLSDCLRIPKEREYYGPVIRN